MSGAEEASAGETDITNISAEVSTESRGADVGDGSDINSDPLCMLYHTSSCPVHSHITITGPTSRISNFPGHSKQSGATELCSEFLYLLSL